MIIIPPEDIKRYITVDENGQWIHDPDMPEELEGKFQEFIKNIDAAKKYKI